MKKHCVALGQLAIACLLSASVGSTGAFAGVSVLTYHYDNARTGANTNETVLTPLNVNTNTFGKLFTQIVDGYVYAQPLVVTNVTIPGKGVHDVVYVATEHDSVYAFDAETNMAPLWQVSFINPAAGVTPVSSGDVGCGDLVPEIGVTSTPVIDPATGTIYLESKTKEITNNVTKYVHRLHALDITTGAEKFGGPVPIQPSVAGTGDGNNGAGQVPFDGQTQLNREALLLNHGVVYLGYASHCDIGPYHGWLIGYNAQTLAFSNVFNTAPNGGQAGIWQSGGGPATDTNGNIYVMTGNGTFDGATNKDYGDSFLKLSITNGLALNDFFTPSNQQSLSDQDQDLNSGGQIVLPDEVGGATTNLHLLVGAGKQGTIYLIRRDNMGQFGVTNKIAQTFGGAIGGSFDTPAYFNKTLYYLGAGDVLKAFAINNGQINTTPLSQGPSGFNFPGATPTISANGTNDAIVWAIESDAYASSGPAILHAYNATNVAMELYNSTLAQSGTRDNPGPAVKFTTPTVANGRVYVGAEYAFSVFGLGTFLPTPAITPDGATFTNSISITITDSTPGTVIYYTLDSTAPTANSILYTGPFFITNSLEVQAVAYKTGSVPSGTAIATFLSTASVGSGTGLLGAYYSNQPMTFTNPPTLTRTDAVVNFNWGTGSPDPSISDDNFTVRWTGSVQAQFNETYTFYTTTDDGVRLWVNGQLLVDKWVPEGATEWNGSAMLMAGQKYPITMEYFEAGGDASATLAWSSPSTAKTIIPQSQLYPAFPPTFATNGITYSNGIFGLQVGGLYGEGYILQTTTNFVNWVSLQTNAPSPNPSTTLPTNVFNFSDPAGKNFPQRFYRVIQQP
jgi:hypothetical protein